MVLNYFLVWCPWKIKEFTIAAATHFNEQVSRDLANIGLASPTPSVRSVSSRASKLSEAGERLHNTKMAAAKAALMEKQTELKRKRSVEIEIKRLEMEMNQKQFELKQQLELAKLEADRDISKAKEKAECMRGHRGFLLEVRSHAGMFSPRAANPT